jgi:hypothetical protein
MKPISAAEGLAAQIASVGTDAALNDACVTLPQM